MSSDKETESFSVRYGYGGNTPPIKFIDTMPDGFYYSLLQCACNSGLSSGEIYSIIAYRLGIIIDKEKVKWAHDETNFSNALDLLVKCEWYERYNIAEILFSLLKRKDKHKSNSYVLHMNRYFSMNGIGWEFSENGKVERRHERALKKSVEDASNALEERGMPNTADMINDAMKAMSHRPDPQTIDAINHAIGAVESVSKEILDSKKSLGKIISQLEIPKPLDQAVEKLWGFSSGNTRHREEKKKPKIEDAELVIHVSAAICTYLIKKKQQKNNA